jgi:hypothetical protein
MDYTIARRFGCPEEGILRFWLQLTEMLDGS